MPGDSASSALDRAIQLKRLGDFAGARSLYEDSLAQSSDKETWIRTEGGGYAKVLMLEGDWKGALEILVAIALREIVAGVPNEVTLWHLGHAYLYSFDGLRRELLIPSAFLHEAMERLKDDYLRSIMGGGGDGGASAGDFKYCVLRPEIKTAVADHVNWDTVSTAKDAVFVPLGMYFALEGLKALHASGQAF